MPGFPAAAHSVAQTFAGATLTNAALAERDVGVVMGCQREWPPQRQAVHTVAGCVTPRRAPPDTGGAMPCACSPQSVGGVDNRHPRGISAAVPAVWWANAQVGEGVTNRAGLEQGSASCTRLLCRSARPWVTEKNGDCAALRGGFAYAADSKPTCRPAVSPLSCCSDHTVEVVQVRGD